MFAGNLSCTYVGKVLMCFTPDLLSKVGGIVLLGCPRHLRCSGVQVRQGEECKWRVRAVFVRAGRCWCFAFPLTCSWFSPACPGGAAQLHDGQLRSYGGVRMR